MDYDRACSLNKPRPDQSRAIQRRSEEDTNERVRNGRTEWVDVVTGLSVNGNIEVFGDLKPAEEVIRNATDAIRPGQQVKTSSSHS